MLLFPFSTYPSSNDKLCSTINYCRVEKKTANTKTSYVKEIKFDKFCGQDRPSLQLEPDLGIELWLFDKKPNSNHPIESQDYVSLSLYTYKLTYVVASVTTPLSQSAINLTHRLSTKEKSIIEYFVIKNETGKIQFHG